MTAAANQTSRNSEMREIEEIRHHARNGMCAIIYECYRLFEIVESDEDAERVYHVIEQCRRIFKALENGKHHG